MSTTITIITTVCPLRPIITADQIIVACEVGGGFQIGWHDDAPSFPSRSFAEAVAAAPRSGKPP